MNLLLSASHLTECSVLGCVGASSGQRGDCVKASECLSDLLYSIYYDVLG